MNYNTVVILEAKLQLAAASWGRRTIRYNFGVTVQGEERPDVIQANILLILSSSICHFNQANI